MSEYTPDEEQVREQYTQEQPPQIGSVAEKSAEFYRFIAKVKADAWDEGLDAGRDRWMDSREFGDPPRNPYRQEGDR